MDSALLEIPPTKSISFLSITRTTALQSPGPTPKSSDMPHPSSRVMIYAFANQLVITA